jgi:hypothetical protein
MRELQLNALPPIPIETDVLQGAYRLKRNGLPWKPRVGCFVWDRESVLPVPSPFPLDVFFVLSMKRFLQFFDDVGTMEEKLVWIPTIGQAWEICRVMGARPTVLPDSDHQWPTGSAKGELLRLFDMILGGLKQRPEATPVGGAADRVQSDQHWVRKVMESELGCLDLLPADVQQRVRSVYSDIGKAYLGWRRIEENRPDDWYPEKAVFDASLLRDLKHFYSDYQEIVQSFEYTRGLVQRLSSIDPEKNPERYGQILTALTQGNFRSAAVDHILEQLLDHETQGVF